MKIFIVLYKVFCRFFVNVGYIIVIWKVVLFLKWCFYGSIVFFFIVVWLIDVLVKIYWFSVIWWIYVYIFIYYVSKVNLNLCKILKIEYCNYKIMWIYFVLFNVEVMIIKWMKIYFYKLLFVLLKIFCLL